MNKSTFNLVEIVFSTRTFKNNLDLTHGVCYISGTWSSLCCKYNKTAVDHVRRSRKEKFGTLTERINSTWRLVTWAFFALKKYFQNFLERSMAASSVTVAGDHRNAVEDCRSCRAAILGKYDLFLKKKRSTSRTKCSGNMCKNNTINKKIKKKIPSTQEALAI